MLVSISFSNVFLFFHFCSKFKQPNEEIWRLNTQTLSHELEYQIRSEWLRKHLKRKKKIQKNWSKTCLCLGCVQYTVQCTCSYYKIYESFILFVYNLLCFEYHFYLSDNQYLCFDNNRINEFCCSHFPSYFMSFNFFCCTNLIRIQFNSSRNISVALLWNIEF